MKATKSTSLAIGLISICTETLAEGTWTFGVLANSESGPYSSVSEIDFAPILTFATDRLSIGTDGLSYEILDHGDLTLGLSVSQRFGPDFPSGETLFAGLDREDSLSAGFDLNYDFGSAFVDLSVEGDVFGRQTGLEAIGSVGYVAQFGPILLSPSVGVVFRDADYNNHFYGVSAEEATAQRSSFRASSTTTAFASIEAIYEVAEGVGLVGMVSYEDLGSNFESPLVPERGTTSLMLGVVYQF